MQMAVPCEGDNIYPHFGKSREFAIFEVVGKETTGKKIVDYLAGKLEDNQVMIIAGGIGRPKVMALQSMGFTVISGASGNAEQADRFISTGRWLPALHPDVTAAASASTVTCIILVGTNICRN